MAKIVKHNRHNITQVSNTILRDSRISFKAKGLFSYMFSMKDDWNFTINSISTQQKEGKDSIRTALSELKKFGYISYKKNSNGRGIYILDDEPKPDNPNLGFTTVGKSERIKNTNITKNTNTSVDDIYTHYKQNIKASASKQQALNNITYWLKKYKEDKLLKSIDNYKHVAESQTESKYIKDCKNFFGVAKESRGYFIDFLNGVPDGMIRKQDKPKKTRIR